MGRFILILLVLIIGSVNGVRQRRQANGCGPKFANIDQALKSAGEGVIVPCCDQHDICYDTCGQIQSQCDKDFRSCLISACRSINGDGFEWVIRLRQVLCMIDGLNLAKAVRDFGVFAYNAAQQAHGCGNKTELN